MVGEGRGAATPSTIDDILAARGAVRRRNVARLAELGLTAAAWIPLREHRCVIRPTSEIVQRLLALGALHGWLSEEEGDAPSDLVSAHLARSKLTEMLTPVERAALSLPRAEAQRDLGSEAPVLLDYAWPLAWVLGFENAPFADGREAPEGHRRALLWFCRRGFDSTSEVTTDGAKLRSLTEVVETEDLFSCAENAMTMAELAMLSGNARASNGRNVIDVSHRAEAVRARRHALTWVVAPGTAWGDVEGIVGSPASSDGSGSNAVGD